jgi:hypothetical protein
MIWPIGNYPVGCGIDLRNHAFRSPLGAPIPPRRGSRYAQFVLCLLSAELGLPERLSTSRRKPSNITE